MRLPRFTAAAVVVMAVLLATAVPASAATADDLASIHETDTDFQNAQTLDNVQVDGSGTGASVDLDTPHIISDFEDQSTTTTSSRWDGWTGDTGSFSAISTGSLSGSYAGELSASAGEFVEVHTARDSDYTGNLTFEIRIDSQTGRADDSAYVYIRDSSLNNIFKIDFDMDGDIVTNPGITDTGADWSAGTTYTVRVVPDFANDEATLYIDGSNVGTFATQSDSNWGGVSLGVDNTDSSQSVNAVIDDLAEHEHDTGQYISQTHDASQVEDAFVDLSLSNGEATVDWQYYDGSTWQTAATNTYSTSGNKTVDVSGHQNADKWRAVVTFSRTTLRGTAAIESEGVLFDASTPSLNNSSATPSGGSQLSSTTLDLEIDVQDKDFATNQSDSVTVTYWTKSPTESSFSKEGTVTMTSNGTASLSASFKEGGDWEWFAVAEDSYGEQSPNSSTFKFTVPATVEIREETPEHPKLSSASVELVFYEDEDDNPIIVNRTVTNGEVDLSGLPVGSTFAVSVSADNYHNRTVVIESIYNQSTIYMLNKTDKTSVETIFEVEDSTGDFQASQTELIVQRAVNDSLYNANGDGYNWTAITGDVLGADNSLTVDLQRDHRYRLVVKNDDGDVRILGAYTAADSVKQPLRIGSVVSVPADPGEQYRYNVTRVNKSGTIKINVEYNDTTQNTSTLYVEIYNQSDPSDVLFANQSYTNLGTLAISETVPSSDENTTWVVELTIQRNGGQERVVIPVGPQDPILQDMPGWLVPIISIGSMFVLAGLFSQVNGDVGAIVLASMGGLWWYVDLLPDGTGVGVVVLAMIVAGLLFVNERRSAGGI